MRERMGFNELENVTGGTERDTSTMVLLLALEGYGKFTTNSNWDYDGLKNFFVSKGYTFIPSEKDANLIIDQEGNTYNTNDFCKIILNDFKS